MTCDVWHVTLWHVTCDMWHVTCDTWHMTCEMFGGVNILSKFQLPSSYCFWFMILWRSERKGSLNEWMNELIIDEAVYRTAPATPGLLNRLCHSDQELSKSRRASKSNLWFKSYGHFTKGVDFASWWSFIGGGSASAACAAGLFLQHLCNSLINWLSRRWFVKISLQRHHTLTIADGVFSHKIDYVIIFRKI